MLDTAFEIAKQIDSELKWKQVGDFALSEWQFALAEQCLLRAKDYPGLFLIHQTTGNFNGMISLAEVAQEEGLGNLTFLCYLETRQLEKCLELLLSSHRYAEAAMFAKTYCPTHVARIVHLWREKVAKAGWKKVADAIGNPSENENLFPGLGAGVLMERKMVGLYQVFAASQGSVAEKYEMWKEMAAKDLIDELKKMGTDLPSYSKIIDELESQRRTGTSQPKQPVDPVRSVTPIDAVSSSTTPVQQSPTSRLESPVRTEPAMKSSSPSSASPPKQQSLPQNQPIKAGAMKPASHISPALATASQPRPPFVNAARGPSLGDGDDVESISDNMSHLSMEVNTTGTGSMRGDLAELDSVSEFSFTSASENAVRSSGMGIPTRSASPQRPPVPSQPISRPVSSNVPLDLDDLDAVLASNEPTVTLTASSKTGDAELDELLDL